MGSIQAIIEQNIIVPNAGNRGRLTELLFGTDIHPEGDKKAVLRKVILEMALVYLEEISGAIVSNIYDVSTNGSNPIFILCHNSVRSAVRGFSY
jgi:hypothetical protein